MCSISQEPYIIWFSFMMQMFKRIICTGFFYIFSKFLFWRSIVAKYAQKFSLIIDHFLWSQSSIQEVYWVFPKNATGNFCLPPCDTIIIPISTCFWNPKMWDKKEENHKIWISEEPKEHFRWNENIS